MQIANKRASKYKMEKLTELKGQIEKPIIIDGDNTPSLLIHRSSRQNNQQEYRT